MEANKTVNNVGRKWRYDKLVLSSVSDGDMHAVKMLLELGLPLTKTDEDGLNLLKVALKNGKFRICRLLLDSYDLSLVDITKMNDLIPVMVASEIGYEEFLLKWNRNGLPLDISDELGNTPFHHILKNSSHKTDISTAVDFLLRIGVNLEAVNKDGQICLHVMGLHYKEATGNNISYTRFPYIFERLLRAGADINLRDNLGRTPLYCAMVGVKNYHCIQCLLNWGADVNAEDNEGRTCIDILLPELDKCWKKFALLSELYVKDLCRLLIVIISHIMRMNVLQLYISKKINAGTQQLIQWLKRFNEGDVHVSEGYDAVKREVDIFIKNFLNFHKQKCELEILKMKDVKLDGVNSLYEFAITKECDSVAFINKEVFFKYFTSNQHFKDFPIYWFVLNNKVNAAYSRKLLLPDARDLLASLNLPLDSLCLEHILKQFNNRELFAFIKAFEP